MRVRAFLGVFLFPVSLLAQDTAGVGGVRGQVLAGGLPARDAAVCLLGTSRCVVSDASGTYDVLDVRTGSYRIEVRAEGLAPYVSPEVQVRAGLVAVVDIALPSVAALETTVTVTAPRFVPPDDVKSSGFLVSSAEIQGSAGALQDVSRYVQSLPGAVLGTDDFRNDLIVRGGSPLENLYIVDNIEIPNINTFANFASAGGTVSILDAQLIQDVTFLTGGFPASYSNRTSSVLQVTQREGSREGVAGRATLGFAGVGGIAEGPLGRSGQGSWIVSARRSFLDLFTNDTGVGGVPILYTLNGKATYDLSPRDRVWLVNVSGIDEIRLGLSESSDLTDELSNLDITYEGWRSASGINWQRVFGARGVGLLGITHARAAVKQRVQDLLRDGLPPPGTSVADQLASGQTVFREDSREAETTLKYDLTVYAPFFEKIQAGASAKQFVIAYDSASPFGTASPYFALADQNPFALRERLTAYQAAAYAQSTRAVGRRLNVTAGARLDHYQYISATRVSPRLGLGLALTPRLSLRAAAGQYYQQPFFLFLTAFPGNRNLQPFRADHFIAGVAATPDDETRLTLEVYRKRYSDYPVSGEIASLSLANVGDTFAVRDILFPLLSAGIGEAQGIELFAERRATSRRAWSGQANLAFSRARHAGRDGILRPGSFDYPVVANLLGAYRLSPRWVASMRLAYLSGRPFTPFDEALSGEQRRGIYDLARVNAARSSPYFRLDVRAERTFTVNGQPLAVFLGAQNVTNRRNVAGYSWDRRNNVTKRGDQLGIFPILGVDWRF